jgi:hypothetical protein
MSLAKAPSLETRADLSLWYGVLAPAAAWVLDHEASVVLTPWVCRTGNHWVLLPVALAALAFAASGGVVAARHFQLVPSGELERGPAPESRRLFMAAAGLLLSLLFFLGIAALSVPVLFSPPCR